MTKLSVSLRDVRVGCAKPHCEWLGASLHRHHRRHEALWFGAWAHRRGEPQWQAFIKRYREFRPEDVVKLCANHHAEIHSIYDQIIAQDLAQTGLPLYLYSWKQGKILMRKLGEACDLWLLSESPGIDSELYGRTRRLRWSLLAKQARRQHPEVKRPAKRLKRRRKRRRSRT